MKKRILYIALATLGMTNIGCNKWLEVPPEGVTLQEDALKTPDDLQRLLNSCYDVMGNTFDGRAQNIAELLSDNLTNPLNNLDYRAVYDRETTFFNNTINSVYGDFYNSVYRCNTLLDAFELIEGLSGEERQRIDAEARFVRALNHWWALKLYAQPWGYTSDNSHLGIVIRDIPSQVPLARSTVKACYDAIIADFETAYANLPESNGVYANKYAAAAMLAEVYFQKNDYANAVEYANIVINSGNYTLDPTLDIYRAMDPAVFGTTSPEAIFTIATTVNSDFVDVRNEGFRDNYWPGPAGAQLSFSDDLVDFFNLTPSDQRISSWILSDNGQYQNLRYGTNANESYFFSIPLIRLSTLHLLRAEALAELGTDLNTAIEDINLIRDRAFGVGFNDVDPTSSAAQIITYAREEFRKETIGEGHRISQIRRIGAKGESIVVRDAPWNCPGMAIQFPNSEFTGVTFVGNPEGGCN
jgi:tetratricopeptide (TPR) repeat protein